MDVTKRWIPKKRNQIPCYVLSVLVPDAHRK